MSDREPEDRRLKDAFAAPLEKATPSGGCPGDERIWAAAHGELPPGTARDLLAHSLDCAACAESFRMAAEIAGAARTMTPAAGHGPGAVTAFPGHRRRTAFVFGLAAAAAIVLMVAVPILMRRQGPPPVAALQESVHTGLWRVGPDRDEPLRGGEAIRPGDRLYLTVESDVPLHLYVLNRDRTGEATALFPIKDAQWTNPLRPGTRYRLPGETTSYHDAWEVTSAGGTESFFVIASRQPMERLESAIAQLKAAAPGGPDETVRGQGPPPPGSGPGAAFSAVLDEVMTSAASSRDLVVLEIVLENPP